MFTGTLKPYQPEAVDRMVERGSMLVAYEMGLGKTVCAIAACEELMEQQRIGAPVLVIALSSLKYQWQKEIHKFSNSKALVIDGTRKQREAQYDEAREWSDNGVDYVVVNYETVVNDWELIRRLDIGAIVCDEATAIKSFRSKRSKKVKELSKKIDIRFALTGTPVENGKPEELYSIMQFVDKDVLGRFDLFDDTFIVRNQWGGVQRYRNLPVLHKKLMEASVRKSQNDPDVAPYLPDTIHRDPLYVKMHPAAAKAYNLTASALLDELAEAQNLFGGNFSLAAHYGQGHQVGGPADAMRGSMMSKITVLRMLADHPQLLLDSAAKFAELSGEGSQYAYALLEEHPEIADALTKAGSPKVEAVLRYIEDHLDTDPDAKVVVFTTYLGVLPILHDRLSAKNIKANLYSGMMNAKEKEESKTEFQTSTNVRVLISSDAGGYGVDLPQANLLINFDLPWSAGTAVQRNSRIRRASSRWPSVTIQDVLAARTIEERQWDMLQQKNAVADAVLDGKGVNSQGGIDLSVGSLYTFLSKTRP